MSIFTIASLALLALGIWRTRSATDPPSAYVGLMAVGLGAMFTLISLVVDYYA